MIDLHTHSVYSDGTDTPAELVAKAEERGLSALALTDHDSVAGIPELLTAGEASSVEVVPGIELSAECERGTMHVLGYFIDHSSPTLQKKIELVRKGREERNVEILKKLNRLGYRLLWEDIERQAGKDVVGRPHIAAALVEQGHMKSKRAAFDLLLAKGRPGYVERTRYQAKECVELIRQAGGVPVLAHPATIYLPSEQLRALVAELKEHGLGGIEAYYAENRPENIRKFTGWAKELDLVCTGGTDYHGKNSPDLKLGTGFGQLRVPDEALEQLKAVKPAAA
ncbi:MAG: PHP domain-containing protein [Verrucomicrobiota bacterium]